MEGFFGKKKNPVRRYKSGESNNDNLINTNKEGSDIIEDEEELENNNLPNNPLNEINNEDQSQGNEGEPINEDEEEEDQGEEPEEVEEQEDKGVTSQYENVEGQQNEDVKVDSDEEPDKKKSEIQTNQFDIGQDDEEKIERTSNLNAKIRDTSKTPTSNLDNQPQSFQRNHEDSIKQNESGADQSQGRSNNLSGLVNTINNNANVNLDTSGPKNTKRSIGIDSQSGTSPVISLKYKKKDLLTYEGCSANQSNYKGRFFVCKASGGGVGAGNSESEKDLFYICEFCRNNCHKKHRKSERPTQGRFSCKCAENDHKLDNLNLNTSLPTEACIYNLLFQYTPNDGYYIYKGNDKNLKKKHICAVCYKYCSDKFNIKDFEKDPTCNEGCICQNHDFSSAILLKGDFYARQNFTSMLKNFNFNIFCADKGDGGKNNLKNILLITLIQNLRTIFGLQTVFEDYNISSKNEDFKIKTNKENDLKKVQEKVQTFLADQNNQAILTIFYISTMKWNNKFFYLDNQNFVSSIKCFLKVIETEITGGKDELEDKYDKYKAQIYLINLLFNMHYRKEIITNYNLFRKNTILNMNIYQRYYYIHYKEKRDSLKKQGGQIEKQEEPLKDLVNRLISLYKKMQEEFSSNLSIIKKMKLEIFPCFNNIMKYVIKYNVLNEGDERNQRTNIKSEYFELVKESLRSFTELREKEKKENKENNENKENKDTGKKDEANQKEEKTCKDYNFLSFKRTINKEDNDKNSDSEDKSDNDIENPKNLENDDDDLFNFNNKSYILILKNIIYYLLYKNDSLIYHQLEDKNAGEEFINNITEKQAYKTMQNIKFCFYYILNYENLDEKFSGDEKILLKELISNIFKIACSDENDSIYFKSLKNLKLLRPDFKTYHEEISKVPFKGKVLESTINRFLYGGESNKSEGSGVRKYFRLYSTYFFKSSSSDNNNPLVGFCEDIAKLLDSFFLDINKNFNLPKLNKEKDDKKSYEKKEENDLGENIIRVNLKRFQQYLKTTLIFQGLEEVIYPIGDNFEIKQLNDDISNLNPTKEQRIQILQFYALIIYDDPEILTLVMNINPIKFINFFIFVDDELYVFLNRILEMCLSSNYYYSNLNFIRKCVVRLLEIAGEPKEKKEEPQKIDTIKRIKIVSQILKLLTKILRKAKTDIQLEFSNEILETFNIISKKEEEEIKPEIAASKDSHTPVQTKPSSNVDQKKAKKSTANLIKTDENKVDKKGNAEDINGENKDLEGQDNNKADDSEGTRNVFMNIIYKYFKYLILRKNEPMEGITEAQLFKLDEKERKRIEQEMLNTKRTKSEFIANYLEFMACLYESDISKYYIDYLLYDEKVIKITALENIIKSSIKKSDSKEKTGPKENIIEFRILYPLFHYYIQKKLPARTNILFYFNYVINMISDVSNKTEQNQISELMNKSNVNFVNTLLVKKYDLKPTSKAKLEEAISNEVKSIFSLVQTIQDIINEGTFEKTFLQTFNDHINELGSNAELISYYCKFFQNIVVRPLYFLTKNIEMYIEYIRGKDFSDMQHVILDFIKSIKTLYYNINMYYNEELENTIDDYMHSEKINLKSQLFESDYNDLKDYKPLLISKNFKNYEETFSILCKCLKIIYIYDYDDYKIAKEKEKEYQMSKKEKEKAKEKNNSIDINNNEQQNLNKKDDSNQDEKKNENIDDADEDELISNKDNLPPLDRILLSYKNALSQKSEFIRIQNDSFDLELLNSEYFKMFSDDQEKKTEDTNIYKIGKFRLHKISNLNDFISIMKCISDFDFLQKCDDKKNLENELISLSNPDTTKNYLCLITFTTINEIIRLKELHPKDEFLEPSLHCRLNKLLTKFFQILCEGDQKKLKNHFFRYGMFKEASDSADLDIDQKMKYFENTSLKLDDGTNINLLKSWESNKKKSEVFSFFNIVNNTMRFLISPFQPNDKIPNLTKEIHTIAKFDMCSGINSMFSGFKDLLIEMIQGCTLNENNYNFDDEEFFSLSKEGPKSYSGFYYLCNEVGRLFKDEKSIFNYRTSEFNFKYLFDEFTLNIKIDFLEILNNILKQSFDCDTKFLFVYQTLTESKRFNFIGDYIKYVYLKYVYQDTAKQFKENKNYLYEKEFAEILAGGPDDKTALSQIDESNDDVDGVNERKSNEDRYSNSESNKEHNRPIIQLKEADLKLLIKNYKTDKKMWKDRYLKMACLIHYIMSNLEKKTKNKLCSKYFKLAKDDISFDKAEFELTGRAHQKNDTVKIISKDQGKNKKDEEEEKDKGRDKDSSQEGDLLFNRSNRNISSDDEYKTAEITNIEDKMSHRGKPKSELEEHLLDEKTNEILEQTKSNENKQNENKQIKDSQNIDNKGKIEVKKQPISLNDFYDARERSKLFASKFLSRILKSIKIGKKNDDGKIITKDVYFTLNPDLYKIKKNSVNVFLDQVDRSSRSSKLKSTLEKLDEYMAEIKYKDHHSATYFNIDLYDFDYANVDGFNFICSLIINLVYLKFFHKNGTPFEQNWIRAMNYLEIFVVFVNLFFLGVFLFTKYNLCTHLLLDKKQREEASNSKENEDEGQEGMSQNYLKKALDTLSSSADFIKIYVYDSFINNSEIQMMMFVLIFGLFGICTNYDVIFYSCQLISIGTYSTTIIEILNAFKVKIDQLGNMILFLAILMYVWATIDLYFFKSDFVLQSEDEETGEVTVLDACTSLLDCFITLFNNGARSGGGIGDVLGDMEYDGSAWYYVRWIHDLLFFVAVILLLLNMINGVIVNTFTQLREETNNKEIDIKNTCFICGVERYEIEKQGKSFEEHINIEHKVKDYIRFLVSIKFMDNTDMDQDQYHVYHCLLENDLSLFPSGSGKEN